MGKELAVDRKRFPLGGERTLGIAAVVLQEGEIIERVRNIRVHLAQQFALHRERLTVGRLGVREIALFLHHVREVVEAVGDLIVLLAEQSAVHRDRFAVQLLGLAVIAAVIEQHAEIIDGIGEVGVGCGATQFALHGHGVFHHGDRGLQVAVTIDRLRQVLEGARNVAVTVAVLAVEFVLQD